MGDGLAVDPQVLRSVAAGVMGVGAQLGRDFAAARGELRPAESPGWTVPAAMRDLAESWAGHVAGLAERAGAAADKLTVAAEGYTAADTWPAP